MIVGNKLDLDDGRTVTGAFGVGCRDRRVLAVWCRVGPRLMSPAIPSSPSLFLWCDRNQTRRLRHSATSLEFRSCVRCNSTCDTVMYTPALLPPPLYPRCLSRTAADSDERQDAGERGGGLPTADGAIFGSVSGREQRACQRASQEAVHDMLTAAWRWMMDGCGIAWRVGLKERC